MTEPQKITGYRNLSQQEIDLINVVKSKGQELAELLANVQENALDHDPRWLAIGRTHLQEGLMALTRSIAKPTNF